MLVTYTSNELDLMARLMRAEALSDGNQAMLMVGNVIINRVITNCDLFRNRNTLYSVITQSSGGFDGYNSKLFQSRSTTSEKNLAKRCIKGEYFYPATHALWFYGPGKSNCKSTWFGQTLSGRFKSHCFYIPKEGSCSKIR